MSLSFAILPFALIILLVVLVISGLIRLRLWGRAILDELRRIRLDIGKMADHERP